MTSEERRNARYDRRVAKREAKRLAFKAPYDDIHRITDTNHLIKSAYMSRKGTSKKASVQKYMMNLMRNVTESRNDILNHKDIRQGFIEFDLHERGRKRHIRAMYVKERVIQRCLCDYALIPVLRRSLVYDNGASLKWKGIHFALFRLKRMLQRYVRKHGTEGYILLIDFSKYFDNIYHLPVWDIIRNNFNDTELRLLCWKFVKAFGTKSLGIGSQVSQILAIAYPNRVDHRIKEYHHNGLSARYMDDSYVIAPTKEELEYILSDCLRLWAALGISVSENKTRIESIKHFTFMKVRFRITESGKVLMLPCKQSFTRMRRKLRKFKKFYEYGYMSMDQINASYQSWYGYQNHFNAYNSLRCMDSYFYKLFNTWPNHGKRRR